MNSLIKFKLKINNWLLNISPSLSLPDFVPPIFFKVKRKIFKFIFKDFELETDSNLKPFIGQELHSFSQFQEDLLIDLLLDNKLSGFYVDVGANDPFVNNNTQRFYSKGWRGINIEPNQEAYKKIKENRINDVNLNIAISNQYGESPLYLIGKDSSISSINHKQAIRMSKNVNSDLTSERVKTDTLASVFDKYLKNRDIDFMSVDAEGYDLEVLKSNNWNKYRPAIVLVEANINTKEILCFMNKNNYSYVFSNYVNALFVDKKVGVTTIYEEAN